MGAPGGGNPVSLTGTVFSEDTNRRIEHATVRLCDAGGNLIQESITNDNGDFSFRGLEKNNYILNVDAIAFEPVLIHVELSFASDRGLTVYLKPIAEKKPAPSSASTVNAHELSMPQGARNLVASGKKKMNVSKDPQGALADFEQAVTMAPGYYEAYYNIGMVYLSLGNSEESEKSFRKAIEASSDKYGDAEIALGTVMLNRKDNQEGEKAIRRGLDLSPSSWLGHYELGRALLNENKLTDAEKSAEQARSLAPNAPMVYRLLANVHLQQNNFQALLGDLDAYIKLDPDSSSGARAKELRGQVQQRLDQQAAAGATSASSTGPAQVPNATTPH
jgi:tetratricopeptide (TPR) repeat protein